MTGRLRLARAETSIPDPLEGGGLLATFCMPVSCAAAGGAANAAAPAATQDSNKKVRRIGSSPNTNHHASRPRTRAENRPLSRRWNAGRAAAQRWHDGNASVAVAAVEEDVPRNAVPRIVDAGEEEQQRRAADREQGFAGRHARRDRGRGQRRISERGQQAVEQPVLELRPI